MNSKEKNTEDKKSKKTENFREALRYL